MKTKSILFIALISLTVLSSCKNGFFCVQGEGERIVQTKEVRDFEKIIFDIEANLHITKSDEISVTIDAQQNILEQIDLLVSGDELTIKSDKCLIKHEGIDIYISMSDLSKLTMNSSGEIFVADTFAVENLSLELNGSGNVTFDDITVFQTLTTVINGSGNLYLSGSDTTNIHNIEVNGSGNIEAYKALTNETRVRVNGSGNSFVYCLDKLGVQIYGSGNVSYKGTPDINSINDGSGKLINGN